MSFSINAQIKPEVSLQYKTNTKNPLNKNITVFSLNINPQICFKIAKYILHFKRMTLLHEKQFPPCQAGKNQKMPKMPKNPEKMPFNG